MFAKMFFIKIWRTKMETTYFDKHIWDYFLEFLEANHELTEEGFKVLKEGVTFDWKKVPNRNAMVANELWQDVLSRHLHNLNYN